MGHGQVLGFLPTYIREQGGNAGVVQFVVVWIASKLGLTLDATILLECIVDLALVSLAALIIGKTNDQAEKGSLRSCLLYTSPSPRD